MSIADKNIKLAGRFFAETSIPAPQNPSAVFTYNFFVHDETTNDTGESLYDPTGRLTNASQVAVDDQGNRLFADANGKLIPESGINVRAPRHVEFDWQAPSYTGNADELFQGNPTVGSLYSNNLIIEDEDITSLLDTSIKTFDPGLKERIKKKSAVAIALFQKAVTEYAEDYGDGEYAELVEAFFDQYSAALVSGMMQTTLSSGRKIGGGGGNFLNEEEIAELDTTLEKIFDANVDESARRVNDLGQVSEVPVFQNASSVMSEVFYDRRLLGASANSFIDRVPTAHRKVLNYFNNVDSSNREFLPAEIYPISSDALDNENEIINIETETPILKSIITGPLLEDGSPFNRLVLIGYVIERYDSSTNFQVESPEKRIYIDGKNLTNFLDTTILYGQKYYYLVRAVWGRDFFDFDISTGEVRPQRQYFASKPTDPVFVDVSESVPPNEPDGVFFKYNYSRRKGLVITWQYPTGRKRDTKYFQVFRRKSIHEPFTCIAELDFDNSSTKFIRRERVIESRVIKYNETTTFYEDIEFDRSSSYIYAVASVDAHGLSSGYSAQTRVTFNKNTNRIELYAISRPGAPKQYPNFFVDPDEDETTFVRSFTQDVMTSSGKQRVKIYLDPDCEIIRDSTEALGGLEEEVHLSMANTDNGIYKLHFINLDRQKDDSLEIRVNDFREDNE